MRAGTFFSVRNRFVAAFIACFIIIMLGAASASTGPALTETLTAGPYIVNVNTLSKSAAIGPTGRDDGCATRYECSPYRPAL